VGREDWGFKDVPCQEVEAAISRRRKEAERDKEGAERGAS